MATVEIFDPAMCCSTGACGTDVDPTLARFAADVDWLAGQGVAVKRATLAQEPGKLVASEPVRAALEALGTGALPAIVVDGVLKSTGAYPPRDQIASWAGLPLASAPAAALLPMAAAAAQPTAAQPATGGCCGGSGCC